ncbi:hypothetical protein D3C76_1220030 [compost metagenome]
MGTHHHFDGGGDHFTSGQNVAHAEMPFGDTVTGSDSAEHHADPAGFFNALQYLGRQLIQIGVAGRRVGIAVDHGDHRTAQLFVAVPHRFV